MTNTDAVDEYLESYLKCNNIIETREEGSKRQEALSLLKIIQSNFTRAVLDENNYRGGDISCLLLPFGSYGLGGYIRNADIDIVLICPHMVKRKDFFEFFPKILNQISAVQDVEVIKNANVPIIKFVVDNISIDVSFVRLREDSIDQDIDLLDDKYLKGIHDTCKASMDGPRVNRFIKNQIKHKQHIHIFQRGLQCVKHWATVRQIYNKPIGYLNGSSWTLLLLKTYMDVCNTPQLTIYHLICSFFNKWKDWPWPTPVLLTRDISGENARRLEYKSLPEFTDAVMPIITPCYPVSSAAPNVTKATLKILTREFERAALILDELADPMYTIRKLFNPVEYFKRYHDFITIITSSTTQSSHETWQRKIPNVIPQLVQMIEKTPDLKCIQPIIRPKVLIQNYHTNEARKALEMGMSIEEAKQLDLNGQFNPGTVNLAYFFIGIKIESSCQYLDISDHIESFEKLLHSRRTKHDDDVRWHVTALKRKKVKDIVFYST
ncbi:Poly(A) polymerase central domain-containing protein [Parasitella parasitica]|nr:Poly(A) polymerase central domain-containing protein [Parasitella parasitica]